MPVEVNADIQIFAEDKFHQLAERVIGIVFDVHNQFGRLLDEEIYKQGIRKHCEAAAITPALREVEIKVRFRDFEKSYFMDLLLANGLLIEAKTVEKLTPAHHAQTLQYLLLTGMHHGLLLNLRSGKVEKRFVSTTLDLTERRRYEVLDTAWLPFNEASQRLREVFLEMLDDWGTFLQTSLYRQAIVHLFGGPDTALRRIPIYDGSVELGTNEVCLIANDTIFALTALKQEKDAMNNYLRRFLSHTKQGCLQWINMDNHEMEFTTLTQNELAE